MVLYLSRLRRPKFSTIDGTIPLPLALVRSSQDVLSNFFGGLMLLLAEPFIPGDMVTFQRGGVK